MNSTFIRFGSVSQFFLRYTHCLLAPLHRGVSPISLLFPVRYLHHIVRTYYFNMFQLSKALIQMMLLFSVPQSCFVLLELFLALKLKAAYLLQLYPTA